MSHKIQITVDDKLYAWFKEYSSNYGMSFSALTNMAMGDYKMQKEVVGNLPKMMEMLTQIQNMSSEGVASFMLQNKDDEK